MPSLQPSVVRIDNISGSESCTGFVTYDGMICTCAHGVANGSDVQEISEQIEVYFDDDHSRPFRASVDLTRIDFDRDIAFLRLAEPAPTAMLAALPLADFTHAPNGRGAGAFVMRGYPEGLGSGGGTKDILVADSFEENGTQCLSIGETTRGFSGAPVWDVSRGCVIGMVIERYQLADGLAGGFAVSSREIRSVGKFAHEFSANPHKFLEPFAATANDAGLYFGREDEVNALRDALNTNRVVIVSGDSGVGKSSFVRAGLFMALKMGPPGSKLLSFMAGSDPFLALTVSLAAQFPDAVDGTLDARRLEDQPEEAAGLLLRVLGPNGVVSLDQYERMATECKVPRRRDALKMLIQYSSAQGVRWVVAVRSDFPLAAVGLQDIVPQGKLGLDPMERSELRNTIVRPALACHRVYEPAVIDLLLDAVVGKPSALPLLQFSLSKLWEVDVQSAIITADMLAKLGFDGAKRDLLSILRNYAQKVWSGLGDEEKAVAHNLLAKFAVIVSRQISASGSDISFAGRHVAESELDDVSRSIAEKLAGSHLLVVTADQESRAIGQSSRETRTYSLAHEFLLTAWNELRNTCYRSEPGIAFYAGDFSHYLKLFRLRRKTRLPDELLKEAERLIENFPQLDGLFEGDSKELILASRRATDDENRRRRNARKLAVASATLVIVGAIAGYLYFAHTTTLQTLARVFESRGALALADRNFAEAEIFFAKSLTLSDRTSVRDLLLQARSAGVSVGSRSPSGLDGGLPSLAATSRDGAFVAQYDGDQAVTIHGIDESGSVSAIAVPKSTDAIWLFTYAPRGIFLAVSSGAPGGRFALRLFGIDGAQPPREMGIVDKNGQGNVTWKRRVSQVAYDHQHGRFIVASEDASLTLFTLAGGQARQTWTKSEAHTIAVHGVTFSSDGRLAATAGADYAVRIWDVDDESREPLEVGSHQDSVFAVAFSHNGSRLASGGYDRAIRLWDIKAAVEQWRRAAPANTSAVDEPATPETVRIFQGHSGVILDLHFSADNTMLASVSKDESARIWDVDRARQVLTLRPHNGRLRGVAFDSYGRNIVVSGDRGWSQWHTSGRKEARKLWTSGSPVSSLIFDRSSRFLAVGDADGRLVRWGVDSEAATLRDLGLIECKKAGDCGINGIATSADGHWLVAGGQGYVGNVWDVSATDWKKLDVSLQHVGPVWGLAFDTKSGLLATSTAASKDQNPAITLWSVVDWKPLKRATTDYSNYAVTQCGAAGRWIVGDASGRLHAYNDQLQEQAVISNVDHGETNVWGLSCAESLGLVFSANSDGRVRAWDGISQNSVMETSRAESGINPTLNTVAVDMTRGRVAASGDGDRVQVYGFSTGSDSSLSHAAAVPTVVEMPLAASFFGQEGTVWMTAYSPDGHYLAYGGLDGFVKLINLTDVQALASTRGTDILRESEHLTGLRIDDNNTVEAAGSN